jgi:hypothetical protein
MFNNWNSYKSIHSFSLDRNLESLYIPSHPIWNRQGPILLLSYHSPKVSPSPPSAEREGEIERKFKSWFSTITKISMPAGSIKLRLWDTWVGVFFFLREGYSATMASTPQPKIPFSNCYMFYLIKCSNPWNSSYNLSAFLRTRSIAMTLTKYKVSCIAT